MFTSHCHACHVLPSTHTLTHTSVLSPPLLLSLPPLSHKLYRITSGLIRVVSWLFFEASLTLTSAETSKVEHFVVVLWPQDTMCLSVCPVVRPEIDLFPDIRHCATVNGSVLSSHPFSLGPYWFNWTTDVNVITHNWILWGKKTQSCSNQKLKCRHDFLFA